MNNSSCFHPWFKLTVHKISHTIISFSTNLTTKYCLLFLGLLTLQAVSSASSLQNKNDTGMNFTAEAAASIAAHPSGDLILWRKEADTNSAVLELIPRQGSNGFNYSAKRTLYRVEQADAICQLSISNGGVIYVGWQNRQLPLALAGYSLNGGIVVEIIPETEDNSPTSRFSHCAISTTIGDRLAVSSDDFVFHYDPKISSKAFLAPRNGLQVRSGNRPFIGSSGGTGYLKKPAISSKQVDFCINEPGLFKNTCTSIDVGTDEQYFNPILITDWELCRDSPESDIAVILPGDRSLSGYHYVHGGNRLTRVWSSIYPDPITPPQVAITINAAFNEHVVQEGTATLMFLSRGETSKAHVIHEYTLYKDERPALPLPASLIIPESTSPAVIVEDEKPCDQHPSYQPIHQIYTTADGKAFLITINRAGNPELKNTVEIPYLAGLRATQTTNLVIENSLVVLAAENNTWRLTDIDLNQFNLQTQQASLATARGSNDLSYGFEVDVSNIPDSKVSLRWALVHINGEGQVISFTNDLPADQAQGCGRILTRENRGTADAIGMKLPWGSSTFGVMNSELVACINKYFQGYDIKQSLYLMTYKDEQWQFTNKVLNLTASFFSTGSCTFWWRPYVPENNGMGSGSGADIPCHVLDFNASLPRLGVPEWMGGVAFGYARALFRADRFDYADNPTLPPSPSPHKSSVNNRLAAGISVLTVTASLISIMCIYTGIKKYIRRARTREYNSLI